MCGRGGVTAILFTVVLDFDCTAMSSVIMCDAMT